MEDLTASQSALEEEFRVYQEQVRVQSQLMQQSMDERSSCAGVLRSRVAMVEESNSNLT